MDKFLIKFLELRKMFDATSPIQCCKYSFTRKIYNLVKTNPDDVKIVKIEWLEKWKSGCRDLTNWDKVWCTYDYCTHITFYNKDNVLCVDVMIWNGDPYDGKKESKRCSFTLELPWDFLNEMQEVIETEFEYKLNREYDEYLEEQGLLWMENRKKQILSIE